jgi:hypothetical protein
LKGDLGVGDEEMFTSEELLAVDFEKDVIYPHATAGFHYTTYDVHRDRDTINTNTTRQDVMVLSNEDPAGDEIRHPFWYARVLGVYHANVLYGRTAPRQKLRMDFLFVRWFGLDDDWQGGSRTLRLDRIGFVPENDLSGAFAFLEPSKVLRACHLIPAFAFGKTTSLLGPGSKFRDFHDGDWEYYYVNRYYKQLTGHQILILASRFVDRDMVMRYLGLGVGHNNAPTFPCEEGLIREDVLIENDEIPWQDRGVTKISIKLPARASHAAFTPESELDTDTDSFDGRLATIAEEESEGEYEW